MDWQAEDNWAERGVDAAAAATFAAAVGFALWAAAASPAMTAAGSAAAFAAAAFGLRQVSAETPSYAVPDFPLPSFQPTPAAQAAATGELILEDELAEISPDARVVRLFGARRGQCLNPQQSAPPDASQALSEALAELRRSLR